jgi:hypothetical protein
VNGIAARFEREAQNLWTIQIGRGSGTRQGQRFVPCSDVQRGGVFRRVDRDAGNAELRGCTRDPDRDFAAIGDEQPVEHGSP